MLRVLLAPESPVPLLLALVQMWVQEQTQAPIPVQVQVHELLLTPEQGIGHPLVLRKLGWAYRLTEGGGE